MHKALKVVLRIAFHTISALTMAWQIESGLEFSTVALRHCSNASDFLEFRLRDVHVCDPVCVYVYVYAYNPACDQDETRESKTGPCRYWKVLNLPHPGALEQ